MSKQRYLIIANIILFVLLLGVITYIIYTNYNKDIKIVDANDLKDEKKIEKTLDVTPKESIEIKRSIESATPNVTYYIKAPDLTTATRDVTHRLKKQDESLPKEIKEKTDKTIVTPNKEQQKVDVYKINLRNNHKIKTGIQLYDKKAYPMIAYQAGKYEVGISFDRTKVKGCTVLYTLKEW